MTPGTRTVWLLALGGFAIGTDTFVVAGVLPSLAEDLEVTLSGAGQVVTVFAVTFGVLAPLIAALTAQVSRKKLLLVALGVFVVANALSTFAPNYGSLLACRVLAAAGAAAYTPAAAGCAAMLVPAEQRARALSIVLGGTTVATVLGVPFATYVGSHTSWRAAFAIVAVAAVLAALALALTMPDVPTPAIADLRTRLRVLGDVRVLGVIATTLLLFLGGFTVYTYIAPALVSGAGVGQDGVVLLLVVFGVAGVVGNMLGGRLTDKIGPFKVLMVALAVFATSLLALPTLIESQLGAAVALTIWGVTAWMCTVPQQYRLFGMVPKVAIVAIGLNSSAVFLGIGLSGATGGLMLHHMSVTQLGYVGGGLVLAALVVALVQQRLMIPAAASDQQPA
jgi:predicted MFS family arabinose efflux permease